MRDARSVRSKRLPKAPGPRVGVGRADRAAVAPPWGPAAPPPQLAEPDVEHRVPPGRMKAMIAAKRASSPDAGQHDGGRCHLGSLRALRPSAPKEVVGCGPRDGWGGPWRAGHRGGARHWGNRWRRRPGTGSRRWRRSSTSARAAASCRGSSTMIRPAGAIGAAAERWPTRRGVPADAPGCRWTRRRPGPGLLVGPVQGAVVVVDEDVDPVSGLDEAARPHRPVPGSPRGCRGARRDVTGREDGGDLGDSGPSRPEGLVVTIELDQHGPGGMAMAA